TTSLPWRTSSATSATSEASHSRLRAPLSRSASSAEPILTTIRRACVHSGRAREALAAVEDLDIKRPGRAPDRKLALPSTGRTPCARYPLARLTVLCRRLTGDRQHKAARGFGNGR